VPIKSLFDGVRHIRVESFKDDISNNLISMFVFFFNFVRPHSALNGLTPAQVAGLKLSKKQKREYPLVA
jgi:transposase InsO family protein